MYRRVLLPIRSWDNLRIVSNGTTLEKRDQMLPMNTLAIYTYLGSDVCQQILQVGDLIALVLVLSSLLGNDGLRLKILS